MRSVILSAVVLTLTATLYSCGAGSPVVPSHGISWTLTIVGPSTIAPGSMVQLSAVTTYPDTGKNVTESASWRSSDASVLTISATGLASAQKAGEVLITATVGSANATQSILVVPTGTFKLSGQVTTFGTGHNGAVVQVIAGIGVGLSSRTVGGTYKLYGVAGDVQVTVSEASFATITQTVTVNGNTILNFEMVPLSPSPNIQGTYTLHITADPTCEGYSTLPSIARERQYQATIQSDGHNVIAAISGALFEPWSNNRIYGWATAEGASFDINDPMYYYSGYRDIAEVLPDGSIYLPSGTIDVSSSTNGLTGTLSGAIRVTTANAPVGQCLSATHSVKFTSQAATPARNRR